MTHLDRRCIQRGRCMYNCAIIKACNGPACDAISPGQLTVDYCFRLQTAESSPIHKTCCYYLSMWYTCLLANNPCVTAAFHVRNLTKGLPHVQGIIAVLLKNIVILICVCVRQYSLRYISLATAQSAPHVSSLPTRLPGNSMLYAACNPWILNPVVLLFLVGNTYHPGYATQCTICPITLT
jgi:hypothetical protein